MRETERTYVPKVTHVERLEILGKIIPLRGVVGRKESIEKPNKVAVEDESDVAYSDLVVEATRSWLPYGVAVIQACELLPIGVVVGMMGHEGEERKEQGGRRCLLALKALNWRDGTAMAYSYDVY